MKIVIEASSFKVPEFVDFLAHAPREVEFILLVKRRHWFKAGLEKFGNRVRLISYKNFEDFKDFNWKDMGHDDIIRFQQKLFDDHQTMMLFDRTGMFPPYGPGLGNYTRWVSKVSLSMYSYLKEEGPDYVFFRTTPHGAEEWPFANVAEFLGIPVLVAEATNVFWRQFLMRGFRKERQLCIINEPHYKEDMQVEERLLQNFVAINTSAYEDARPLSEIKLFEQNRNKYFSFRRELKYWWKRPDMILSKWKCLQSYKRLWRNSTPNKKYIILFLHYQPERTSLPESFGFAQQLLAIQALRASAPETIDIFVKEHPGIFIRQSYPSQRHPTFYTDISSIQGVYLASLDLDTFNLIDNAVAVATLTGSVGRQAMLRGKPTIYFGRTVYRNDYGIHSYDTLERLKAFISECVEGLDAEKVRNAAIEQMKECVKNSFSGVDANESTEYFDYYDNRKFGVVAQFRMLNSLVRNGIKIPGK